MHDKNSKGEKQMKLTDFIVPFAVLFGIPFIMIFAISEHIYYFISTKGTMIPKPRGVGIS
jgi:hypothetical protein